MGAPVESNLLTFSTACGPGGPAIEGGVGYSLSNVKIAPAPACSAANMATNKPSPALTNITVCTPNLACTGGACLDAVDAVSMCIAQAGAVTCPMGFSTRSIVALGVTDARACVGCACGSTLGCTFESLLTDNDVSCDTMNPYNFNATTGCVVSPAADSAPFNSCQATAMVTGSGGCTSVAASMSTGSVTLAAASTMTVCCP